MFLGLYYNLLSRADAHPRFPLAKSSSPQRRMVQYWRSWLRQLSAPEVGRSASPPPRWGRAVLPTVWSIIVWRRRRNKVVSREYFYRGVHILSHRSLSMAGIVVFFRVSLLLVGLIAQCWCLNLPFFPFSGCVLCSGSSARQKH